MKSKRKKRLSGFTLVELIVVLAIFSGICAGALAMVRPAMQIFNKASSQESAGADIDNISRYIQDNLRFADRVNIYQGYGALNPTDMMGMDITGILPSLEQDPDDDYNYKKVYLDAKPLEFFRKYYFSEGTDFTTENADIYIMEIQGKPDPTAEDDNRVEGMVSVYKCYYDEDSDEFLVNGTADSVISDKFYDDYGFSITNWSFASPNLTIDMNINYKGTIKDSSGNTITLNQQESINLNFINISLRASRDVIQQATLATQPTGVTITVDDSEYVDIWGNEDDSLDVKNNKVTTRPAKAYKNFTLKSGDEGYNGNGNTYIVYTVPQIIAP